MPAEWAKPAPYSIAIEAVIGALVPSEMVELLLDWDRFSRRCKIHLQQHVEGVAPRTWSRAAAALAEVPPLPGTTRERPEL